MNYDETEIRICSTLTSVFKKINVKTICFIAAKLISVLFLIIILQLYVYIYIYIIHFILRMNLQTALGTLQELGQSR